MFHAFFTHNTFKRSLRKKTSLIILAWSGYFCRSKTPIAGICLWRSTTSDGARICSNTLFTVVMEASIELLYSVLYISFGYTSFAKSTTPPYEYEDVNVCPLNYPYPP